MKVRLWDCFAVISEALFKHIAVISDDKLKQAMMEEPIAIGYVQKPLLGYSDRSAGTLSIHRHSASAMKCRLSMPLPP